MTLPSVAFLIDLEAVTGYPTALRWLKIHHPELLVSKPDEASVVPVAVAPVAPELPVQKQPDPAQKKRTTVKATANKLLPKPLRNPKTHPELLAERDPRRGPRSLGLAPKKDAFRSPLYSSRDGGVLFTIWDVQREMRSFFAVV